MQKKIPNVDTPIKLLNTAKTKSESNLYGSFNYADIIYSYIDYKDNSLNLIIFDTWDFNPGENWIIKMARRTQDAGIIRNYYLLILIDIPFWIWNLWFKYQLKI